MPSKLPDRNSDSSPKNGITGNLFPVILFFPVIVILVFHLGNRSLLGSQGSFLIIPFRFLARLYEFRVVFPEGFFFWILVSVVVMFPTWLLGWSILRNAAAPPMVPFLAAFPVGLGIVGVILEALALFGWFTRGALFVVYGIIVAVAVALIFKAKGEKIVILPGAVVSCGTGIRVVSWSLFSLLSVLAIEHAVFFPPTYHDALIYYLYYAKLIFLNHGIPFPVDKSGFPELVQCQVGLGLGANYPHLFLLWQASVCSLVGLWSSFPGQLLPPLAGICSGLLVYSIVLSHWKSERLALWSLLLAQSVPYWIWYQSWVSDYPLAVWFTVASIALFPAGTRSFEVLVGLVALATAGCHLNYLMGSLWLFPILAWWQWGEARFQTKTLTLLLSGLVLSSTWFIRNWIVTGNPVYAFFPEIFGGKNVRIDVLRSCEVEWNANGDGFNQVGHTFFQRLVGLPGYFLLYPGLSIKWATLPIGWFLPGLFPFVSSKERSDQLMRVVLVYTGFYFFYGLLVSGMYLYHLMPVVPMMVLIACRWMRRLDRFHPGPARVHSVLVLLVAFTVGLPAAVYGPKLIGGTIEHTLHPGRDPEGFLHVALKDYYKLWQFLNKTLPPNSVLLTHENRHYYLRDDIRFLHLDDYRLIDWYDRPAPELLSRLEELGVGYYLRIPNEKNHPIVKRLGIDNLLGTAFRFVAGPSPDLGLYRLVRNSNPPDRVDKDSPFK